MRLHLDDTKVQFNVACEHFDESMHEEGCNHICCELNAIPRTKKIDSGKKNKVGLTPKKHGVIGCPLRLLGLAGDGMQAQLDKYPYMQSLLIV